MLARDLHAAAPTKLQIDFEEAWVVLSAGPVELHEDGRCAVVERPRLRHRLVVVEFESIQLQPVSGQMNIGSS